MLIYYGSFMYFAYILIAIGICVGLFFILKNKSDKVKRIAVLSVAFLNLVQHLLKGIIYPHYWGDFSPHLSSAYNVCAFLIIISPFIILWGNELLKNYLTYLGTIAGMIAMLVPYWFIGQSAFQSEAYRFYLCHSLLFVSSLLPALLRMHTMRWRHFWKIGLLFLAMLGIIILNDLLFLAIGQYPVSNPSDIYGSLCEINPCWSVTPPKNFDWLVNLIRIFTPLPFEKLPILWYAIPMYAGITLVSFCVCALIDFNAFRASIASLKEKLKKKSTED